MLAFSRRQFLLGVGGAAGVIGAAALLPARLRRWVVEETAVIPTAPAVDQQWVFGLSFPAFFPVLPAVIDPTATPGATAQPTASATSTATATGTAAATATGTPTATGAPTMTPPPDPSNYTIYLPLVAKETNP